MYRKSNRAQMKLEGFFLPFGGHLSSENRWVRMAKLMPWELIEDLYAEDFVDDRTDGRPALPARIAYGSIYIKEQENLSDERTVEYISENPFAQYFLGLSEFRQEALFDSSMLTHFRKRFTAEKIEKINESLYRRMPPSKPPEDGSNDGTLILDATAAPADMRYPTDLSLLNECRENTERIIDKIWESTGRSGRRTRYSRKKARAKYLKVAKQRKPRKKKIRKRISEQLTYTQNNIALIDSLLPEALNGLNPNDISRLEVIRMVVHQQAEMLRTNSHSIENRIVSLRQPHVRPIVRGKAKTPVEFGQKIAISVVRGYTFIEKQMWNNFSEGSTLKESAEKYKERHGVYPAAILADMTYRNRENLRFCKEVGIRLTGPRLGRPKAEELKADKKQAYKDSCERNMVEGRIGIGKRRYGLDLIMAKLASTAQTEAALNVLVMNVALLLRAFLRLFSKWVRKPFMPVPFGATLRA